MYVCLPRSTDSVFPGPHRQCPPPPTLPIAGGPAENESLAEWRTRLQSKLAEEGRAEERRAEEERRREAEARRAEEQRRREAEERRAEKQRRREAEAEEQRRREAKERLAEERRRAEESLAEERRVLGEQIASFSDLHELTRHNRETLEEVKLLVGKNAAAGSSSSGTELADTAKLGELDEFIAMAKTLDEMTVSFSLGIAVGT